MTKTERIITMMRFINNRQFFTLHNLCEAFSISRSTAIRDLAEIQSLGLPLVSSVGPDGGYAVMHNQLLQKSKLTSDELRALIISFLQATDEQLPYLKNPRELLEKLFSDAMPTEQDGLLRLQEVLLLDHSDLANMRQLPTVEIVPKMLTSLFKICMVDRQISVKYSDHHQQITLPACYVHYIFHEHGTWYADLLDEQKRCNQVLPVGSLLTLSTISSTQRLSEDDLQNLITETARTMNVQLELEGTAITNFHANHFFHDTCTFTDKNKQLAEVASYLDLTYPNRIQAFANWIIALGAGVTVKSAPPQLISCLSKTVNRLKKQYG